ncbi:helix-turn-helix domain-containing protein [Fibrella aestuarina]|uniref:helix-turn-helix domain-containing protein n=1 Tax=Fibrella aestuarina TaxID=651143 RepID=UPI0011D1E1C5|nr:helix-turn-helix domain-containing protein [Fibrella aestuarina]
MLTTFIQLVILLGGLQGLLIGLVHAFRRTPVSGSRYLGWALAVHALNNIYMWLYWTKWQLGWKVLILLPMNLILLPVYLLYSYVYSVSGAAGRFSTFRRFLMVGAGLEVALYLLPAGAALYQQSIDSTVFAFAKGVRNWLTLTALPIVIVSCLVLYNVISLCKQSADGPDQRAMHQWFYRLWAGLSMLVILALFPTAVSLLGFRPGRENYYPLGISSSLFLLFAGIWGFIRHERTSPPAMTEQPPIPAETPSAQAQLYQRMIELLESEQLYRQPNLKLADVAERLSVSPPYLSRIINQFQPAGFIDLVNTYRVDAVKRLMTDPAYRHYTLEGLGLEAGFGAKSTYQAAFKRLTGQTPSQYRAKQSPVS